MRKMKNKFNQIKETLSRLHTLQAEHLDSFNRKQLPDLEKQSEDRSMEMDKLLKDINAFFEITKSRQEASAEAMFSFLSEKVTGLMEQNKALEIKVRDFKNRVKQDMKQVSKGNQVISSYKSATSVLNSPKVISLTN